MAINDIKVLLSGKDAEGNTNTIYPITRLDCVEGAGALSDLETTEKSNLVSAINELANQVSSLSGITYVESTDNANLVSIRDMESGTYVFYGKFKPYAASTSTLTFSSKLLVNIVKRTADTQVMVFYPVNNCVQYLKITDDTYERKNIYLNDLMASVDTLEASVGTMSNLATTDQSSLVAAINEVASKAGSGGGSNVQADWNENDENAPGFIKNRTHWYTARSVEFDGTVDGKETYTIDGAIYIKISDEIFLTAEEFIGGVITVPLLNASITVDETMAMADGGIAGIMLYDRPLLLSVSQEIASEIGITGGTFTMAFDGADPFAFSFVKENIQKLDEVYMPESYVSKQYVDDKHKDFTLIKSYEITDSPDSISEGFDLREFVAFIQLPKGGATGIFSISVHDYKGTVPRLEIKDFTEGVEVFVKIEGVVDRGLGRIMFSTTSKPNEYSSQPYQLYSPGEMVKSPYKGFTVFRYSSPGNSEPLSNGTKVEIWGIE